MSTPIIFAELLYTKDYDAIRSPKRKKVVRDELWETILPHFPGDLAVHLLDVRKFTLSSPFGIFFHQSRRQHIRLLFSKIHANFYDQSDQFYQDMLNDMDERFILAENSYKQLDSRSLQYYQNNLYKRLLKTIWLPNVLADYSVNLNGQNGRILAILLDHYTTLTLNMVILLEPIIEQLPDLKERLKKTIRANLIDQGNDTRQMQIAKLNMVGRIILAMPPFNITPNKNPVLHAEAWLTHRQFQLRTALQSHPDLIPEALSDLTKTWQPFQSWVAQVALEITEPSHYTKVNLGMLTAACMAYWAGLVSPMITAGTLVAVASMHWLSYGRQPKKLIANKRAVEDLYGKIQSAIAITIREPQKIPQPKPDVTNLNNLIRRATSILNINDPELPSAAKRKRIHTQETTSETQPATEITGTFQGWDDCPQAAQENCIELTDTAGARIFAYLGVAPSLLSDPINAFHAVVETGRCLSSKSKGKQGIKYNLDEGTCYVKRLGQGGEGGRRWHGTVHGPNQKNCYLFDFSNAELLTHKESEQQLRQARSRKIPRYRR